MSTRRLLMFAAIGLAACNSVDVREPDTTGGGGGTSGTTTSASASATTSGGGGSGGNGGGDAGAPPCLESAWSQAAETGAPKGRDLAVVAWTGKLCIWSGTQIDIGAEKVVSDGACYDRATGSWGPMSALGAPSSRVYASAAWTGTELLIWGGKNYYLYCLNETCGVPGNNSGARYDPAADTWAPMATTGAPSPRWWQSTVWTGSDMIIWGGSYQFDPKTLGDGARYNLTLDTWSPVAGAGAPSPRFGHLAAWTGSAMLVWGGRGIDNTASPPMDGALYDPVADSWAPIGMAGAPAPRWFPAATYGEGNLFIWGGSTTYVGGEPIADGHLFSIAMNTWAPLPPSPLSARRGPVGAWTGKRFLVWGGYDVDGHPFRDGAFYDPVTSTWEVIRQCGPTDSLGAVVTTSAGVALYNGYQTWFLDEQ